MLGKKSLELLFYNQLNTILDFFRPSLATVPRGTCSGLLNRGGPIRSEGNRMDLVPIKDRSNRCVCIKYVSER